MSKPLFLDIPPLLAANGTVHLPGSKSISNRVLLLAGLCSGSTTLHGVLDSDDTRVMLAALERIGCEVVRQGTTARITGIGGRLPVQAVQQEPIELFLGNAGTAMRPLTAALAMLQGRFLMTGVPRMYERPIGDLVDGLRQLGCDVEYAGTEGYPPLRIGPRALPTANANANANANAASTLFAQHSSLVRVRGDVSSQFLTALLMAAPLAGHTITFEIDGELISKPYIAITLNLLQRFGVTVQRDSDTGWKQFTVEAGAMYQSPGELHIEADASSASYFIALGAIASDPAQGHSITVQGVGADSIQGDIRFIEAAEAMGASVSSTPDSITIQRGQWPLRAIDLDCNHIPDAAMTLAVMALYADGTTTLRNIASWRVKETDRIAAMARELRKLGASVEEGDDYIRVTPPASAADWRHASIHTYDDHRMAMCLSLAAFNPADRSVRIEDPACVGKTFPHYFDAYFGVCQADPALIPVLCVDGPSASGKGTLSTHLAKTLGYHLLDSGALYRIVGLAARRTGLLQDEGEPDAEAIARLAASLPIRFADGCVWLDGEDISDAIRTEQGGMDASTVSAMPPVRTALVQLQHSFRKAPGLIADGRDMGTVIFPDATLKVFLTASAEKRAQRRYNQLISKGFAARIDDLRADLQARDARDTSRAVAPLQPAQDALPLDNSDMDVKTSVQLVLDWWQDRQPFPAPEAHG